MGFGQRRGEEGRLGGRIKQMRETKERGTQTLKNVAPRFASGAPVMMRARGSHPSRLFLLPTIASPGTARPIKSRLSYDSRNTSARHFLSSFCSSRFAAFALSFPLANILSRELILVRDVIFLLRFFSPAWLPLFIEAPSVKGGEEEAAKNDNP